MPPAAFEHTHTPNKRVAVDRSAAGIGLYCYLTAVSIKYCKQQCKQMRELQIYYCYYVSFPTYLGVFGLLNRSHGYHSNNTSRSSDFYMSC
jgi:hypothetical protein